VSYLFLPPAVAFAGCSLARHMYQLATDLYGRQRSPYSMSAFGLGCSVKP
jgi:hypothetical protein